MRCAERARLVVVLRGRSAATHVAAIRKRPRRHEWVAFLTMSFVFMVSEVRAPVMGTDARKTLDQFSNRANASRSSRKVSNPFHGDGGTRFRDGASRIVRLRPSGTPGSAPEAARSSTRCEPD